MRPLKMLLRLCVLLGVAFLARAEGPPPEPRTALIIGNSAYSFAPLKNPINDAEAMATALEGAGFKVIKETDADQAKMVEAVRTFGAELKRRGGVGLFYFSGHGTQIDGENYLLPVGEQFASLEDVKRRSVTALAVVDAMASAHSDLNIFILDACRNNPIDPNGAKGLSRIDSNARLFISYATSPGLTALDGEGNNSPYAKYLYQSIDAPNLDIEDTFKRTLKGVYVETHGEQTPWIASTFFGDFVFRPSGEPPSAGEEKAPAETAEPEEATPEDHRPRRGLSRRGHQSQRQQISRHGGARAEQRPVQLHLVDRQGRVPRHRALRRQDAGGELGRQDTGHLHFRR